MIIISLWVIGLIDPKRKDKKGGTEIYTIQKKLTLDFISKRRL